MNNCIFCECLDCGNVFSIPVGFLTYGGKYKVEIGAVADNGNRTFMEYEITTAKRP